MKTANINLSRGRKYMLAEALIVIALIAYIIIMRASTSAKDIPVSDIAEKLDSISSVSELVKGGPNDIQEFFGIADDVYTESYYRYSESGLDMRQVLVLKCADADSCANALDAVKAYNAAQMKVFADYAPDQYALLKKAEILTRGSWCFYAVGENAYEWEEAFLSLIR